MSKKLQDGSAKPVVLVDPNTRKILAGGAIPVYLIDSSGNFVSWSSMNIGDVEGGNYVHIDSDGGIRLYGSTSLWDDMRVSVNAVRVTGANQPGWSLLPNTTSIYTWHFGSSGIDEVWFAVQFPHGWKEGSDIEPHVHWTPNANGTAGQSVEWSLDYTWVNVSGTIASETTITGYVTIQGDSSLVEGKHYITPLGATAISGTGKTLSSMLICRLFRNGGAGNDNYPNTAALLEVDFHYEIDSFGSRDEFTK